MVTQSYGVPTELVRSAATDGFIKLLKYNSLYLNTQYIPLVEFTYFVFTRMPGESIGVGRIGSFAGVSVFRALISTP